MWMDCSEEGALTGQRGPETKVKTPRWGHLDRQLWGPRAHLRQLRPAFADDGTQIAMRI